MSQQSKWLPGSGVYDPVTTTNGLPQDSADGVFSKQDWHRLRHLGRIYNFGTYRKGRVKQLYVNTLNRVRPKCLYTCIITTFAIVVVILVVLVTKRHSTLLRHPELEAWINKSIGLNFMPVGKNDTLFFDYSVGKGNEDTFLGYTSNLTNFLSDYKTDNILSHLHVLCNESYHPADKVCQQPLTLFGKHCTATHRFGYHVGQPCILLYFNLARSYTMQGLDQSDGDIYLEAKRKLGDRFSSKHIGVSCETAGETDWKLVKAIQANRVAPVKYYPSSGFPAYFFRRRTLDTFIPPAVMVQFNNIDISFTVRPITHVVCTAWGRIYNAADQLVNTDMYTASLFFRIV